MELKDLIDKLGTNIAKSKDSNNYKLLEIVYIQLKKLEDAFTKQLSWMDIAKAQGSTLDLLGARVGIARGTMDDAKYRIRIRAKIAQNLSDGTLNKVSEALAMALNTSVRNVHVDTLWQDGQPATLIIKDIPIAVLNQAAMTQEELVYITQQIVAAGIKVESINLKGTFRFSSIINKVEENLPFGFSDVAMTVGGKLGAVLSID